MTGFLEEKEGVKSSMRLMNLISLTIAGFVALIQTWKGLPVDMAVIGFFGGGAFGPKLIQKYMEKE